MEAGDFAGFKRDPFEAVPVRDPRAEHREDGRKCYQIRMRLEPGEGVGQGLAFRLGLHKDVRVDLDVHGSYFWSVVDGERNLYAIEKMIRKKFSLKAEDSRKATLLFTRTLMLRHLIQLNLGDGIDEDGTSAGEDETHAA